MDPVAAVNLHLCLQFSSLSAMNGDITTWYLSAKMGGIVQLRFYQINRIVT